jgi:hypothetical protein
VWFDYHKKCAKGAVHNLAELREPLAAAIGASHAHAHAGANTNSDRNSNGDNGAYATFTADRTMITAQTKLVRTNCVDCLDRTNVVQTAVARWVLHAQLRRLDLVPTGNTASVASNNSDVAAVTADAAAVMTLQSEAMEKNFRAMWGSNGDAMSMLCVPLFFLSFFLSCFLSFFLSFFVSFSCSLFFPSLFSSIAWHVIHESNHHLPSPPNHPTNHASSNYN